MAMICLFSCGTSKEAQWKKAAEEIDKTLPLSIPMIGELTAARYADGNLIFNISVSDDTLDIDKLDKNFWKLFLLEPSDDEDLLTAFHDTGIVVEYKGKNFGREAAVSFSKQEVTDALNDSVYIDDTLLLTYLTPNVFIGMQIEKDADKMPYNIKEGMTMTNIALEDGYVVYTVVMNEHLYSVDALKNNIPQLKTAFKQEIEKTEDFAFEMLVNNCAKSNKGIAYKYVGDTSGKSFLIKIEASEL